MTQGRIIEVLTEHGELSMEELMKKLPDMALSTIRHELLRLRRNGLIEGRYVFRLKKVINDETI